MLGWYLSMKNEDNFLRRIPDLHDIEMAWDMSSKFGIEPNRRTIGILLVTMIFRGYFNIFSC